MKKILAVLFCSVVFCRTPDPVPEMTEGKLKISSQRLVLPKGEQGALFFQTAKQQGLIYLPAPRAVAVEEFERRNTRMEQLAMTDRDGRAGNWGGVQFSYDSVVTIWQRYEFDVTLPGFCGGELRIFFVNEKKFARKMIPVRENLPTNTDSTKGCPNNMTPRVSPEMLQLVAEQVRDMRPLRYSYRVISNTVEIYFPEDIP